MRGWVYDPYRGLEGLPEALIFKLGVWINRVKNCTASGRARKTVRARRYVRHNAGQLNHVRYFGEAL